MKCILLHGLGQNSSDWNETVNHMGNNLEIFCPDIFQWLPKTDVSYSRLYQGLEEYCQQFDEPFVLVGLSLGGMLALQYAAEHSPKVYSLVLIGAQFSIPKNILKFQNMIFRILPNRAFVKMGIGKKELLALCNSMMDLDFYGDLKHIHCNTLLLCGKMDKVNQPASIKLNEQIKNSQLILVPNAGHEVNKDNPIELANIIKRFCLGKE